MSGPRPVVTFGPALATIGFGLELESELGADEPVVVVVVVVSVSCRCSAKSVSRMAVVAALCFPYELFWRAMKLEPCWHLPVALKLLLRKFRLAIEIEVASWTDVRRCKLLYDS
jgi:hypothetical protein